jgi:hypothetical protein
MQTVLFSVMRCCEAQGLFALSSICAETRSIFTSRVFWKARFAFLGIQHKEPSLQVYRRCLKIEKGEEWPKIFYYRKLNLERLAEIDPSIVLEYKQTCEEEKRLLSELDQVVEEEEDAGEGYYYLNELQSLFYHYLVVDKKDNLYTISKAKEKYDDYGYEFVKVVLLSNLSKVETLNTLLYLYKLETFKLDKES